MFFSASSVRLRQQIAGTKYYRVGESCGMEVTDCRRNKEGLNIAFWMNAVLIWCFPSTNFKQTFEIICYLNFYYSRVVVINIPVL